MIELVRLGSTNHVATSRKLKADIVTARLALASGYQSLLRTNPSFIFSFPCIPYLFIAEWMTND